MRCMWARRGHRSRRRVDSSQLKSRSDVSDQPKSPRETPACGPEKKQDPCSKPEHEASCKPREKQRSLPASGQVENPPLQEQSPQAEAYATADYSTWVRARTWSSRAWLYWRSIWSSVCSFLTRSSRQEISARSLWMSEALAGRVAGGTGEGGAWLAGAPFCCRKASATARGQTDSVGFVSA